MFRVSCGDTKWGTQVLPSVSPLSFSFRLVTMAHQCPICSKHFTSKITLRNHTGTNDAALRRAHTCHKCERSFCSNKTMEQHRGAPSHSVPPSQSVAPSHVTMFRCDVCKRSFGSNQAVAQHKKTTSHKQMLAHTDSGTGAVASSGLGNVSSQCCGVVAGIIRPLTCIRGFILPSAIPHIRSGLHFD